MSSFTLKDCFTFSETEVKYEEYKDDKDSSFNGIYGVIFMSSSSLFSVGILTSLPSVIFKFSFIGD